MTDDREAQGQRGTSIQTARAGGPALVLNLVQQLEARGPNVPSVMQQLGVDPSAMAVTAAPLTVTAVRAPEAGRP